MCSADSAEIAWERPEGPEAPWSLDIVRPTTPPVPMQLRPFDRCALVGMVHLAPPPRQPALGRAAAGVEVRAWSWPGRCSTREASSAGGCDALLVENMGDVPYLRGRVEPETVAAAAIAAREVVLAAAFRARSACSSSPAPTARPSAWPSPPARAFVRCEAFAYAHVADEGWLDACAGELLRVRRALGADVEVWADVQKKHAAHAVTADLTLEAIARGTAFCGADALVVTGAETGAKTDPAHVRAARAAGLPVARRVWRQRRRTRGRLGAEAEALIVGTWLEGWRRLAEPRRPRPRRASVAGAWTRGGMEMSRRVRSHRADFRGEPDAGAASAGATRRRPRRASSNACGAGTCDGSARARAST